MILSAIAEKPAPLIERRRRAFREPYCGSVCIEETYIKVRGQWRYLYRAIDKHGTPVDFLLTARRDLEGAKRFLVRCSRTSPCWHPTGSAQTEPVPIHRPLRLPGKTGSCRKPLQQGIESDHSHGHIRGQGQV
jgi:hypothetical protein